jgi:hypothetical protein
MQGLVKEKFKWGFDVEHQLWNDLYTSREELQEAELQEEENGRINWDRWDKTVEKTKKLIEEELKHYTSKKGVLPTLCVYDLQGNLIQTFPTTRECAAFYGISTVQVNVYVRSGGTYKKRNIKFKKEYK